MNKKGYLHNTKINKNDTRPIRVTRCY